MIIDAITVMNSYILIPNYSDINTLWTGDADLRF